MLPKGASPFSLFAKSPFPLQGIEIADKGIEKRAVNGYNAAAINVWWLNSAWQ
jgi:hypothetical protein